MSDASWLDDRLLKKRMNEYNLAGKAVDRSRLPGIAKVEVGKNPAKSLIHRDSWTPWHHALVYSLAGQKDPIVHIFRGFSYYVAAGYPASIRHMYQSAQIYRWVALRVGLIGWAEVWDVDVLGKLSSSRPFRLGDYRLSHFLDPEVNETFIRDYGTLEGKSGRASRGAFENMGFGQLLEAAERCIIGLRDDEINDVGFSEERLLELISFYSRQIRLWMGLPLEQMPFSPDFTVDLPEKFQGFGPNVGGQSERVGGAE